MSEIVKAEPRAISEGLAVQNLANLERAGSLRRVGFSIPEDVTPDEYESIGEMLRQADKAVQWAVGDFIHQGIKYLGDTAYQYIEKLKIPPASMMQHIRVAERVPEERRRYELTWSHHRSVCHLDPEDQIEWLERAVVNDWPKYELEYRIKQSRTSGNSSEPPGRSYVVEAVLNAAEAVWDAAVVQTDGSFIVDTESMMDLGYALGEGTREA